MKTRCVLWLILPLFILIPAHAQQWVQTYDIQTEEPTRISVNSDGSLIIATSVGKSAGGLQICALKASSTGSVQWAKGYDEPLSSSANGCRQLKSGNFLLWGSRTPKFDNSHANSTDAVLLELSPAGAIALQKTYGVGKWNYEYTFNHVDELAAGGYIACGEIEHLNKSTDWYNDESKGWIVRLDAAGAVLFQKAIAVKTSDPYKYLDMTDVRQTADGGYISVGWYYFGGTWTTTDVGILILKMNAAGDILWQKIYDAGDYGRAEAPFGKFLIEAWRIIPTSDGGYMLVGCDWVDEVPWAAKLDATGKVQWARKFAPKSYDDDLELRDASLAKDGGCMFAGVVYPESGSRLAWFAKMTSTGAAKVNRTYVLGGHYYNHFLGISELAAGGFALIGRSYNDYTSRELCSMTTNPSGATCPKVKPNKYKPLQQAFALYEKTATFVIGKGTAAATPGKFVISNLSAPQTSWCGGLLAAAPSAGEDAAADGQLEQMLRHRAPSAADRPAPSTFSCLRDFVRGHRSMSN
ncbi:MAG: hypothetical protein AB1714_29310 [Acidobacteriota bacterium]